MRCLINSSTRQCPVAALMIVWLAFLAPSTRAAEIPGFTEPYRDIELAAPETGCVVAMDVREGDRVTAGQVLARLDDLVLAKSLEMARAAMESRGTLEAAEADLRMQKDLLQKLEDLITREHATQREVDLAKNRVEVSEANLKAVQEELAVKAAEFERTRAQLERRRVVSPLDGIVTEVFKDQGEFVSANDPTVLRIVQLDPLLIVFSVPAAEAMKLAADRTVPVRIKAGAPPVDGTIEFVSPIADPQSGTVRVRVRVPNPDETVSSGATCTLLISASP